jgi:hypothetical protein
MSSRIPTGTFGEGEAIRWLFQVYKNDGTALEPGDVSSIVLYVYDRGTESEATHVAETPLTPADVVLSSFSTGSEWTEDSTGYNIDHSFVDLDEVMEGGHAYLFIYELRLKSNASKIVLKAVADIEGVFSS